MSDNIKVVVKVRPLIPREVEEKLSCQWRVKNNTLYQLDQNGKESGQCFTFDKVYDKDTKTSDVYEDVAKPIVESATVGINGTIFAYGQTSSGKTYTMTGTEESPGIIPLSVYNLFDKIKTIPDRDFLLRVSYIEIYNDKIKDLLNVENENIKVHETVEGVKINATEKVITTPEELLDYMKEGDANRQIGTTNMNEKSSRSHSIFQITIESREHAEDEAEAEIGCVNVSQLNLVDLAGSERAAQTGATGSRFKEGTFINKSLSVLGLVIKQLSEDNKFINYRDCKLTRILQNSLGGNAKTSIICAVTPAAMEETLSTLQFANRAKAIKNKPEVNAVSTNATMIQKLTKQLAKLQYELERKHYLEQDNILLTMKIDSLKRQILNSFNQKSQSDILAKNRRKTWCAPRRATVSTLHPIQEDQQDTSNIQGFSTPAHKQFLVPMDTMSFKCLSRSAQVDRVSGMSNISEESMQSSEKHDTRVSEIIEIESDEEESTTQPCSPYHKCYRTSKTPPCVLRDKAKKAEKMYQDIIDFTEREKVYPPSVVEYMERLEQHQSVISNLEDKVSTLSKECREKNDVIKLLENKVTESEEQIKSITSNKEKLEEMCQEFNTKLIDLEVSYETLQKKAKTRENELLSLLEEQKTKLLKCTEKLPEKDRYKKEIRDFANMSKATLLINNDSETSINDLKNDDDGELQIELLVTQLQDQLSYKSNEITKLQEEIEHKNQRIISLENFNEEVEEKVTNSNHKIVHLETENSVLKSSIEILNSTIENQKICIANLHIDAQSYNDLIVSLQIELDDSTQIETQTEQVDHTKSELMFSNEKKLVENTEHMKNVIQKLKNLICFQKQEISELKMKIDSISTDKDHNSAELHAEIADKEKQITHLNEELLKFKHETDKSIIEINRLTHENSNLLKSKQNVLRQSSDIELQCESLRTEMKNVVNQKNVEINNLLADLGEAKLNIDELTHKKTVMEEKNKELMIELKTLERKMEDFEKYKNESQKQYNMNKSKEIVIKIREIISSLNGTCFDENREIDNVEEFYRIFTEYINMLELLTKDLKSQNVIIIDNNNKLKTELFEMNENQTIQFNEAIDKIKELFSVIPNRSFNEKAKAIDAEGVFYTLKNYIDMLKSLVIDMKSQNETALKSTIELKEKHESEIQSLKSHLNLIENEKTITENQNMSLIKQYEDLLIDLKTAQSNLVIKDQANTELVKKINTFEEDNAILQSKLASCNNEITIFKSNELELKSHIADLKNVIIEKNGECEQNLTQFETKLKLVQEDFCQKLEMIQQFVFEKDIKISEMAEKLFVIRNSMGNKHLEMEEQILGLQSTLVNSEKTLYEVTNKLKWFIDLLHIDFTPFSINEDNGENMTVYSAIPQFLDAMYSTLKIWKEERNDSNNIKEELIQLQSNYNALLQNFDEINDKYKLSLIEIEEVKSENKDLNNNLLQKLEEFESQKIVIENLHSNIQQLIDRVKSLQDYNMDLQSKCLGREDNFTNVVNKINENTVLTDINLLENSALSEIPKSVLQRSTVRLNCPRTLISICCNKIAEILSNDEINIPEKANTFSLDPLTQNRAFKTPDNKSSVTCTCNASLCALEMLHDNNRMEEEIQKLKLLHQNLIVERDQYKEEIESLLNLTTELHKKIVNHRTILSTLTATTYAENKLLKSQVKVLQHHLKRFQDVCQRDLPSIKTKLSQLLIILKSDPNYFKLPIICKDQFEKESITSDEKSTQLLSRFDTTVESDLLMLDTNVTFASDNTLIANNQTDLDLSNTLCLNNFENLFNESQSNFTNEHLILTESASTLSKENCGLNTQSSVNQTNASYTEVQYNDIITSHNSESACNCECNFNKLQTLLNAKNVEFEELQVKLVEMKDERDKLQEKLNLLSEPFSIEATNKMKNLEQDCLFKINEIHKLQSSLQRKNEELKQLQEEVDSLSTEVMDNISEVDSLRKQLDSFQHNNSELTQKCLKLETILAEKEKFSHGNKENSICQECVIKDDIIQKLQNSQLPHADNNLVKVMDREINTDSERYSKIEEINKNLQNELGASLEDCQKINEEVATIKSHLEKSNLSTAPSINLDDANIFNITKNFRSPERRPLSKLTLTMPDVDEEITTIDLYVCEKMDCWNFYAEEMGLEKENVNHDIKIIDIMRMLYNSLLIKHGNEVENLFNKLRDFETSKAVLKEKFDQLSFDYDKVTQELEDKNNMLKSLSDRTLFLNKIIKEFQEKLVTSENCAELVSQFKEKVLNTIDIELSTSTVNIFEMLIDNIANKQEKDLTSIMSKYTQLKDHMEKLMVEQNNLNENLVHMKNQLADKESKYNTLKMQKEKIHEINNAVTLDIIKKEQELNSIVADGWRKLVSYDIIKAEDDYGALSLGTSVHKLFENCIHMHQKYKAIQNNTKHESEIENLKTEISNMKYLLEDKAKEYESLRSHSDSIQKINQSISSELKTKEEKLRQLMLLHEEVSQKCLSQSTELISNSSKVNDLNRDISALKELLGHQESTIKNLETQIQTCEMEKRATVEQELKLSTMLQEIQNLQHESSELKAVNDTITKEKEHYLIELEKCRFVIKEQNEELSKISAQINNLKEILNEKMKEIEKLQVVGKTVLEENDSLRKECAALKKTIKEVSQQHEEKENEYKRLETNLKTHEKTAEIQNNIIKKLQKQKENDQAMINEKVKSLGEKDALIEQLNERYTELLKKHELILQQVKEIRNNRDSIESSREALEGRLEGLENEMENLRSGRSSLEAHARRRRRSVHDAHRAVDNQNEEEKVFMAVLDSVDQKLTEFAVNVSNNSSNGGVTRPSSRRESGCERQEKFSTIEKDESNGRLSDVTDAARRRRQSVHDLRRSVRSSLTPNDTLNLSHKETKHIEHQLPEEIQRELRQLRDEVDMLRERCNELDEECDQCAEAVRDRECDIVQLTKENEMLETKLEELSQKLKNSESSFVEVAVNTDEDWSNLHAVVVDRMSYDAALEKNRKLTRAHEESQRRVRELRAALTAACDNSALIGELKTIKNEFEACRLKYESLKMQHKALQVENATIAKRLHDLEDLLKKEDDKENRIVESARHKRRTVHDQNRPHDHDSKEEHLIEIQQLREEPERQRRVSTLTVATGSAIVRSQQMSDIMKENHKLKKLVDYLRKKTKKAPDEEEEEVLKP